MAHLTIPVSDEHDQILGPPAGIEPAPVTLVEYGSYDCHQCRAASHVVKALLDRPDLAPRLRFVFRDFPRHAPDGRPRSEAEKAAQAAQAAAAQDRFWEMHRLLFEHQDRLDDASLLAYADALGLDVRRFERELLLDRTHAGRVEATRAGGVASGVVSLPTFFIDGVRHDGDWDEATLAAALRQAAT